MTFKILLNAQNGLKIWYPSQYWTTHVKFSRAEELAPVSLAIVSVLSHNSNSKKEGGGRSSAWRDKNGYSLPLSSLDTFTFSHSFLFESRLNKSKICPRRGKWWNWSTIDSKLISSLLCLLAGAKHWDLETRLQGTLSEIWGLDYRVASTRSGY